MAAACIGNDEFWKECTAWLIRWGILRSDHRANLPDATIGDLASTLRDGVLLCTLLSRIDPQSIDMKRAHLKPALARFLCLRNIATFLTACKTSFHLLDHDLFEETMLFDLNNFHKVLCTLSKLSLTSKASSIIPGFFAQNTKNKEQEEIYQCLQSNDIRPSNGNTMEPSWLQFQIPCPQLEDKEEELYDDLCYVTFSAFPPEEPIDEPYEKRDHVIKELVDTEQNYVEVLTKLDKNFYTKLKKTLQAEHLDIIFFKIPELCLVHEAFLLHLRNLDKTTKLSAIFINMRDSFIIYGQYCANLSGACSLLQELCEKNQEISNKVEELEKHDNNGRFKLRDVLSVPMQRVLKYHLLLEKLVEYTDPKHEEYKDLKRARECMIDVNGYINEYARDTEQLNVIRHIKENIVSWDGMISLEQCGRLVKDGEIKIKPHDDGKVRNRYVFIFQKYMIMCKASKDGKFVYRGMLPLHDMQIDEYNNRPLLNQNTRWYYQWVLVKAGQSTAYTCSVKTAPMKEQMIKALKECIENLNPPANPRSGHKFELCTFENATLCTYCSKYLKGLIYQGYKCGTCKSTVHKECIIQSGICGSPPPLAPLPARPSVSSVSSDDEMTNKLWYVGEMDRTTASARLQARPNGTFLVRIRPESEENVRYALSLKTEDTVKHMKICTTDDDDCPKYFLSTTKYFGSVEKLVENYQVNSLKESFERLQENTRLEYPYKNLKVQVLQDYEAQDDRQLSLRQGQEVVVYRQEGYRDGWWLGTFSTNVRPKSGYFPCQYVQIVEVLHDY